MKQVLFGNIKSYDDLGLFLTSVKTTAPSPKRTIVNVPDSDGVLDLTPSKVKYSNKTIVLTFVKQDYTQDWIDYFSIIRNKLHGKRMNVVIDSSSSWYNDSFVTVDSTEVNGNYATIKVKLDAYPYELKRNITTSNQITMTGSNINVPMTNSDMEVIPVFTTTGSVTVGFGGKSYNFTNSGQHEDSNIIFVKGTNNVTLKGSSGIKVTITYREGRL